MKHTNTRNLERGRETLEPTTHHLIFQSLNVEQGTRRTRTKYTPTISSSCLSTSCAFHFPLQCPCHVTKGADMGRKISTQLTYRELEENRVRKSSQCTLAVLISGTTPAINVPRIEHSVQPLDTQDNLPRSDRSTTVQLNQGLIGHSPTGDLGKKRRRSGHSTPSSPSSPTCRQQHDPPSSQRPKSVDGAVTG